MSSSLALRPTPQSGVPSHSPVSTVVSSRSNTYGFYVSVFDSNGNNLYSWPQDVERKHLLHIPSPSVWGNLVSPDNSINSSQNFE